MRLGEAAENFPNLTQSHPIGRASERAFEIVCMTSFHSENEANVRCRAKVIYFQQKKKLWGDLVYFFLLFSHLFLFFLIIQSDCAHTLLHALIHHDFAMKNKRRNAF